MTGVADDDAGAAAAALPPGDGPWQPFDADALAEMQGAYARDLDWLASGAEGFARFETDRAAPQGAETPAATGWRAAGPDPAARGGQQHDERHAVA